MMITGAQGEAVVIVVFGADTPLHLLHFLLETAGGVAEALEDTADARHIVVVLLHTLLIVFSALAVLLLRIGGHEQFIGISGNGEAVVFVDRNHQRGTETQVGRNELTVVAAAEGNLRTDVGDVHTQAQLTFALTEVDIVLVVKREVGSEG